MAGYQLKFRAKTFRWLYHILKIPGENFYLKHLTNSLSSMRISTGFIKQRIGKTLFTTFACIAIFIACLGLFGLSAFAISQRIKEIGIRKVLGADVSTIVTLLSKDFLILVGISFVIAAPVAWYFMHKWLQDFAYRIGMPWWIFL